MLFMAIYIIEQDMGPALVGYLAVQPTGLAVQPTDLEVQPLMMDRSFIIFPLILPE